MTLAVPSRFNILAVVQKGRLQYEAVLLAASLRAADPDFAGRLYLAEPQPGPLWADDPRIDDPAVRALLNNLGATILPFENTTFGASYPNGNKIEALRALPDEPFLFLDTDTLVTGGLSQVSFDFARPSASVRCEGSWPDPDIYGPPLGRIWAALYDRFGLDIEPTLDRTQPEDHWRRHLYFNAGWFFHQSPRRFGALFHDIARTIRDDPPAELLGQPLYPWLDQIALPLVIHALGGGRPGPELSGLDGAVTCHWRLMPLLFARESDLAVETALRVSAPNPVKKVLKAHEPFRRFLYQGKGAEARALFDRADLPRREQAIRHMLRRAGLWLR
ncbi:hypothetical protein SAMN05878503_12446 [Cereibacter ovatus]|uniref:Uncharacterized protein n=1 Tax=Cereibacter ovatus TaxID=439529 RepID=A0A285D664_9RHOB|nr:hypothetical protein [Cereibacter ovatus]SNX74643.1 hypothetical protein SAMN05878503_12446 [Cereibacter ovatus]